MRRYNGSLTLMVVLVVGCAMPPGVKLSAAKPRAPLVTSPSPGSVGSVGSLPPSAAMPVPTPSSGQAAFAVLKQPASGAVSLKGSIRLDAGYLVNAGAGSVMLAGQGGARLAASGGGRLVGNDAASLVGNDAASMIANASGVVVSAGQGNVIVPLVASGGGNLVAAGGGNLVANGGGNLIANGGGNAIARWSLLATGESARLGEILPAVGMRVRVESTVDGRRIPVGEQADGQPVYEIFTNASGDFTLYVPENVAENVRVVAEPWGVKDDRLRYDMLVSGTGAQRAELDEESRALMGVFRVVIGGYMQDGLEGKGLRPAAAIGGVLPGGGQPAAVVSPGSERRVMSLVDDQMRKVRLDFAVLGEEIGFNRLSKEQRAAFVYGFVDRALARIDLHAIRPLPELPDGMSAWDASMDDFGHIRQQMTLAFDRLAVDKRDAERYFSDKSWMRGARCMDQVPYAIKKPSDFCDFLVNHLLRHLTLEPLERANRFQYVCVEAGVEFPDARRDRFAAATQGIIMSLLSQYAFDDAARKTLFDQLRDQAKGNALLASPPSGIGPSVLPATSRPVDYCAPSQAMSPNPTQVPAAP